MGEKTQNKLENKEKNLFDYLPIPTPVYIWKADCFLVFKGLETSQTLPTWGMKLS